MSSSCSTTITEFPIFFRFNNISINFKVSSGCKPTLGSSNTYIDPTSALPRDVAKLILWVSPPESELDFLFSVKYPSPTFLENSNLLIISFNNLWLLRMASPFNFICLKKSSNLEIGISTNSVIERPLTLI